MNTLTNYIAMSNGTINGNIAGLDFDFDIMGEKVISDNENAPLYRLFGHTPRGRKVEIGAIWRHLNQEGEAYMQLTAHLPKRTFRANLGRYPGQDDEDIMAVIPWSENKKGQFV